jgi:hypothetical protein
VVHLLTQAALVGAALGFVAFVGLYESLTSGRWRRTPIGRNVMALMLVGAVLLSVAVVREFLDFLDPYLEWIRLISYVLIASVAWWRVGLLIGEQRAADRERDAHPLRRSGDGC